MCRARVQKQTADSSVFFGENNSCQNNLVKFYVYERLASKIFERPKGAMSLFVHLEKFL